MTVKIKQVVTKTPGEVLSEEKMTHPAQGCIEVTKPMGGSRALFGSNLKHSATVRVRVSTADGYRGLHEDRHSARQVVCEFEFSEAQWASFVSSQGMGNGTPCTFTYRPVGDYKLERMPEIVVEPMVEKFSREIEESGEKIVADMKVLVERIGALSAAGSSRKALADAIFSLKCKVENLPSNMAFIQEQVGEAMEHVVTSGKAEIEAFAQRTLVNAGLAKLGKSPVQLIEGDSVKSLPDKSKGG